MAQGRLPEDHCVVSGSLRPIARSGEPPMPNSADIPADIAETLIDPRAYADGRIHDTYRWLRATTRSASPDRGRRPVLGGDEARRHPGDQPPERPVPQRRPRPTLTTRRSSASAKMTGSPHLLRTLVQMDAPDHPKYRALTQAWFMPRNLRKLEDRIRDHRARRGRRRWPRTAASATSSTRWRSTIRCT